MTLRDLLESPPVKRAVAAGEAKVGRAVTQLLADERVMGGVQTLLGTALQARAALDRGLKTARQAVNLPTTEEVEELRSKLSELEAMLDGLAARVGKGDGKPRGG